MNTTRPTTGTRCPCGRAGLPDGARQCLMCDLDDAQGSTGFRPDVGRGQTADAPTFRPPADQRCSRCDRILLSAPCGCEAPEARWARIEREQSALWSGLTAAQRIEALRLKAAGRTA